MVPGFLTALSNVAVLGFGTTQVMEGKLSIGDLVAFQALAASFSGPIARLVGLGAPLQTARADLQRIDDVMNYEVVETPPATAPGHRLSGRLELRNVTFGYSRLAPPLIENLSLSVSPGARVAVIGASGSGKSTLVKLAAGLYQPWSGEILLDGQPAAAIDRSTLTQSVAAVDQEITLFADTIRNNITLWDPTIEDAAVGAGAG